MKHKIARNLTALLLGSYALTAHADVLMKWQRMPLPIDLQVEKERVILVDRNVKIGYPRTLDGKLHITFTWRRELIKYMKIDLDKL